jgi:steroid 5-alpha reductase family enzyme
MTSDVWFVGFITAILLFQAAAIPALIFKRNDLADVLWGPAFFISSLSAVYFGRTDGFASLDARTSIILILLGIWSLRLFTHIGLRNLSHSQEDVRYANWRKEWGSTWLWRSYLQVFVLQPLILCLFISPVLHSIASPVAPMSFVAWIGAFVVIFGFIFESLADEQLRRFKSDKANSGRLMTTGLWSWSRHPNYFGEVVQWWGFWLMVIDLPYGWLTAISPIGVTYLILKVSGVSMLENLMKNRPGYAEYAKSTSVFIPLPPRRQ